MEHLTPPPPAKNRQIFFLQLYPYSGYPLPGLLWALLRGPPVIFRLWLASSVHFSHCISLRWLDLRAPIAVNVCFGSSVPRWLLMSQLPELRFLGFRSSDDWLFLGFIFKRWVGWVEWVVFFFWVVGFGFLGLWNLDKWVVGFGNRPWRSILLVELIGG